MCTVYTWRLENTLFYCKVEFTSSWACLSLSNEIKHWINFSTEGTSLLFCFGPKKNFGVFSILSKCDQKKICSHLLRSCLHFACVNDVSSSLSHQRESSTLKWWNHINIMLTSHFNHQTSYYYLACNKSNDNSINEMSEKKKHRNWMQRPKRLHIFMHIQRKLSRWISISIKICKRCPTAKRGWFNFRFRSVHIMYFFFSIMLCIMTNMFSIFSFSVSSIGMVS